MNVVNVNGKVHESDISSIKAFAESNGASPIPTTYHSLREPHDDVAVAVGLEDSIPIIDLSLLTSDDPQIHNKTLQELDKACAEWGVFMLINHKIPENLMEEVMNKSQEFHDLPLEEKEEFDDGDKGPLTPIRLGTSIGSHSKKVHYWRDYLKLLNLPKFNFPHKPPGFREIAFEYTRKIRGVSRKLLEGISESMGLEPNSVIEWTGFDSGLQLFAVNMYPPCPEPHLALGMPPHSDHGLFTLLMQNGIGGLQIKHDSKWVNVNPLPNCLVVLVADQLKAVSNGRYASVIHRAILNNTDTRITVVAGNGPDLDKELGPLPELLLKEKPLFKSFKYRDYFLSLQNSQLVEKTGLDNTQLNS